MKTNLPPRRYVNDRIRRFISVLSATLLATAAFAPSANAQSTSMDERDELLAQDFVPLSEDTDVFDQAVPVGEMAVTPQPEGIAPYWAQSFTDNAAKVLLIDCRPEADRGVYEMELVDNHENNLNTVITVEVLPRFDRDVYPFGVEGVVYNQDGWVGLRTGCLGSDYEEGGVSSRLPWGDIFDDVSDNFDEARVMPGQREIDLQRAAGTNPNYQQFSILPGQEHLAEEFRTVIWGDLYTQVNDLSAGGTIQTAPASEPAEVAGAAETASPAAEPAPAEGGNASQVLLLILIGALIAAGVYLWQRNNTEDETATSA